LAKKCQKMHLSVVPILRKTIGLHPQVSKKNQ
jgi:hypothetical protein